MNATQWPRLGRWALVVVLLAVAGTVALWPRDQHVGAPTANTSPAASPPREDDAALAAPRRRAALRPCPTTVANRTASGPLAQVSVACLGAPGTVRLGPALAGRSVLLNLWASWCVPCREELPVLAAYATQPGAVPVLGVDVQDQPGAALGLLADLGVRYPSVVDPDRAAQRALTAPPVLPVSYLLRPDGSIQRITQPPVFSSPGQVRDAVTRALATGG